MRFLMLAVLLSACADANDPDLPGPRLEIYCTGDEPDCIAMASAGYLSGVEHCDLEFDGWRLFDQVPGGHFHSGYRQGWEDAGCAPIE